MILNMMEAGHDWTLNLCELFLVGPFISFDYTSLIEHLPKPCPCLPEALGPPSETEL